MFSTVSYLGDYGLLHFLFFWSEIDFLLKSLRNDFHSFLTMNGSEIRKADNVGALRNLTDELGEGSTQRDSNNRAAEC